MGWGETIEEGREADAADGVEVKRKNVRNGLTERTRETSIEIFLDHHSIPL